MDIRPLLFCALLPLPAAADATYEFMWQGSGGYSVSGALRFDPSLQGRIIRAEDVTCFAIEGRKDGTVIGRWTLKQLTLDTTWRLHFDSLNGTFLVEGQGVQMPQAWNMNGRGDNCGEGGFGLNIGNVAQDICLDGRLIIDSQIAPDTPLPAKPSSSYTFPPGACIAPDLLGWQTNDSDHKGLTPTAKAGSAVSSL